MYVSHEVDPHLYSPQKGISSEQLEWHVELSQHSVLHIHQSLESDFGNTRSVGNLSH